MGLYKGGLIYRWAYTWTIFCVSNKQVRQGCRKLLKVGGARLFESHFPNEKGHLKFFSREKLVMGGWGGGRGGGLNFFFRTKIFQDISHFFRNMKILGKKRQSLRHFSRKKRALCSPEKGHLPKLGGACPPLFLRP